MKRESYIKDMCLIAMFAAIISVLSLISLPMPSGVPTTLQTFAITLTGAVLGARKGALAVLTYILLGLIGLPIFAGFNSGFSALFGVTGGFLLGFPIMAILAGIGAKDGKNLRLALFLLLGLLIDYSLGLLQFMNVTGNGLKASLFAAIIPFIPADIIKLSLTVLLSKRLSGLLEKVYK